MCVHVSRPPAGALTKNIVAMKERLEGKEVLSETGGSQKTSLSEAQRQKEREIVTKEVCNTLGPATLYMSLWLNRLRSCKPVYRPCVRVPILWAKLWITCKYV